MDEVEKRFIVNAKSMNQLSDNQAMKYLSFLIDNGVVVVDYRHTDQFCIILDSMGVEYTTEEGSSWVSGDRIEIK
jgi:hypothetical protein